MAQEDFQEVMAGVIPFSFFTSRPAERRWGSLGGWNTKPWGHPSSSASRPQPRLTGSGTGADWSYPTSQPAVTIQRASSVRLIGTRLRDFKT